MKVFLDDPVGLATNGIHLEKISVSACKSAGLITARGFLCKGHDTSNPLANTSNKERTLQAVDVDLHANVECDIIDNNGCLAGIVFSSLNGNFLHMNKVSFCCRIHVRETQWSDISELRLRVLLS